VTRLRTFADLVDLADSGETEGRVENTGPNGSARTWYQVEVENIPGMVVFGARGTSWTYDVQRLRTDQRLRDVIKRNAARRRSLHKERTR
jgi:hypothetical protein